MPAVILMPMDAPQAKVDATRVYGGEVILFDRYTQDREALTAQVAIERGMTLIPPFNHPDVMAGQGTAAKELLEEVGELDVMLVPLGGGGLLSGTALATRALSPRCRLYGVEPEAGNDGQLSLAKGEIVSIPTPRTLADGAQTQQLGTLTFEVIRRDVTGVVTANDAQLVEAMRFFAERMKMVVEPTGCLGFAAACHAGLDLRGKRVGVVVSGGNVDLPLYAQLLSQPFVQSS
jgi:threo-3-hydroxy-L-aspartate ammonia-lyase